MLTSPPRPTVAGRDVPRGPVTRPPTQVIVLDTVRQRRHAPIVPLGRTRFRVVSPRLQPLARWVIRAGWRDWADWFYEPDA
ncbi:MAG: hypothetical protein M0Z54_14985 [Thermaerobacter sp.]|nr:hypothetical protein [Thermaerobacter sp.]